MCTYTCGFTDNNYKIQRQRNPLDITLANYELKLVTTGHKHFSTVRKEVEKTYLGRMNIMDL